MLPIFSSTLLDHKACNSRRVQYLIKVLIRALGITNDIFWLASCTKLVTAIACMQLVEQGKLNLDNLDEIEHYCPELRDVKVIEDDGSLTEKKRGITLRMLLTHTGESNWRPMQ
jgi:CubicO group peptidase (beta-lactamase class C family)